MHTRIISQYIWNSKTHCDLDGTSQRKSDEKRNKDEACRGSNIKYWNGYKG